VSGDGLPGHGSNAPKLAPITIRTERLVLREKRIEDAADDFAWRGDTELARYDAVPPLRMAYDDFQRLFKSDLRSPPVRQLVLGVDDLNGTHIGNCMCYDIDLHSHEAELGIMIGRKDRWSQGYGTEAIRVFLPYVFQRFSLTRVYLHTLEWNQRAQRAFEKSGFSPLGKVVRNGYTFILMEIRREAVLGDGTEAKTAETASS